MVKQDYLVEEASADAVAAMRAIKQALDPLNNMNPGKIFPEYWKRPQCSDQLPLYARA